MTSNAPTASTRSRQQILDRLRVSPITPSPALPADLADPVRYADKLSKFVEMASWVGASVQCVNTESDVEFALRELDSYQEAKWIASAVPSVISGNFLLDQVDEPRALASLDWAVIRADFGVAENGAMWFVPPRLAERSMVFLAQRLAIVVREADLVSNMHEAYARIDQAGQYPPVLDQQLAGNPQSSGQPFGVFISGPSKTADIEQSLVLGAHGCRTLHVFVITS